MRTKPPYSIHVVLIKYYNSSRLSTQSAITNLRSANLLFMLRFLYIGIRIAYAYMFKENKSLLFCACNVFLIYVVFLDGGTNGTTTNHQNNHEPSTNGEYLRIFNQFTAVPLYSDTIHISVARNNQKPHHHQ